MNESTRRSTAAIVRDESAPSEMHRSDDARLDELRSWIATLPRELGCDPATLAPASSDASFRRYFRIDAATAWGASSLIAMDAPPPQENVRPFVTVAQMLRAGGVAVPAIHAADVDRGFLLLDDFGSRTLLAQLQADPAGAEAVYRRLGGELVILQRVDAGTLPPYDRGRLLAELRLFPDWYVARQLQVELSPADTRVIDAAFDALIENNLAQPQVFVHRDYHSRNLMMRDHTQPFGVLDFQDALRGPITYDIVSLLRDAYLDWPEEQVLDWSIRHWEAARAAGLPVRADFGEHYRDFEWMGVQRHLKVLGIFARLSHRDGKHAYLDDLPRVRDYLVKAARRYRELAPLARLLETLEARCAR